MCGIFGAVNRRRAALSHPARAAALGRGLRHRGPDGNGCLRAPDALVGATRLAIVDLTDTADQPFTSPDGQVWLVCNGEIYNAPALRRRYEHRGYRFRSRHSDVEVILPLYLEFGERAVEHLDGMFALAIYDQRQGTLVLARDRCGEKSVFHRTTGDEVWFASEMQPLLTTLGERPHVSQRGLSEYLALGYCLAPNTMIDSIHKLEAGCLLIANATGVHRIRYWHPTAVAVATEQSSPHLLRSVISRAVDRQVAADVPIGVFLSGGLDSSLLTTETVRARAGDVVHTYTAQFEHASYDEAEYARVVAARLGTTHREVTISYASLHRALDIMSDRMTEPLGDAAALPTYLLAEAAGADVKVILTGEGADELFGGYPTYLGHLWATRYQRLPRVAKRLIRAITSSLPVTHRKVAATFLAQRFVTEAERGPLARHLAWFGTLDRDATATYAPPERLEQLWRSLAPIQDTVKRAMAFDLHTYVADNLLTKIDRATMLASVEARAPFLDRTVVEHALATPRQAMVTPFRTKITLRRAASGRVPRRVIARTKRGLSVPIAGWINTELRGEVDALLAPDRLAEQGLLNPTAVLRLLEAHRAHHADHARRLWPMIMLQRWYDRWIATTSPLEPQHPADLAHAISR